MNFCGLIKNSLDYNFRPLCPSKKDEPSKNTWVKRMCHGQKLQVLSNFIFLPKFFARSNVILPQEKIISNPVKNTKPV